MSHDDPGPFDQMADELKLQAWLAGAELRHPSLGKHDAKEEVSVLAKMRDEIRVQASLGKLEARDGLEELDKRWREFKHVVDLTADDVGEDLRDLLRGIRDQSQKLLGRAND